MSLATTIQKAVEAGVGALSGIYQSATYHEVLGNPTYDTDTGEETPNETTHALDQVVFTGFNVLEHAAEGVELTDQKAIIPKRGLTFEPDAEDWIEDAAGNAWQIIRVEVDPADAAIFLHIRPWKRAS